MSQQKSQEQTALWYRGGKWVVGPDVRTAANAVRFCDIKYFYANIIDYVRVIMCTIAYFTMDRNQPALTAFLIMGSVLLDWVDGPVARAYNQCCIFGSGVDWLADIQAEIAMAVWWSKLDPSVTPWILIATTIDLTTCIFDFALTATGRYPTLSSPQTGINVILEWAVPAGNYSRLGVFIWLAYPIYVLSACLDKSWPVRSEFTGKLLQFLQTSFFIPAVMYIWHEGTYGAHIIRSWTEPERSAKKNDDAVLPAQVAPIAPAAPAQAAGWGPNVSTTADGKGFNDCPSGFELLGEVEPAARKMLVDVTEELKIALKEDWTKTLARREIFWVNLWQHSGDQKKMNVRGAEEVDAWVRRTMNRVYGPDVFLDGFGIIVNPINSSLQHWHMDYRVDYSTIFIPITPITPRNATQYLVLPPNINPAVYNHAIRDLDKIDFDYLVANAEWVSIRQLIARPLTMLKMDFGTIHRGISNTDTYDRIVFWISVRKLEKPLVVEPPIKDFAEGAVDPAH